MKMKGPTYGQVDTGGMGYHQVPVFSINKVKNIPLIMPIT